MSGSPGSRGRTNPPGNDESSESEEDGKVGCLFRPKAQHSPLTRAAQCLSNFSGASAGRFRSKVREYEAQADVCRLLYLPICAFLIDW